MGAERDAKRPAGFYWVRLLNGVVEDWVISRWNGTSGSIWAVFAEHGTGGAAGLYGSNELAEIDERPIERHFNRLSPAELERLACLAEEAGEVIQAVGKVIRHGFEDGIEDNRGDLQQEVGDFDAVRQRMTDAGDITDAGRLAAAGRKDAKLRRFTRYQPDSLPRSAGGLK